MQDISKPVPFLAEGVKGDWNWSEGRLITFIATLVGAILTATGVFLIVRESFFPGIPALGIATLGIGAGLITTAMGAKSWAKASEASISSSPPPIPVSNNVPGKVDPTARGGKGAF